MFEFLINDFWHMIFCKFDQSISIFPYEKAVGHRLIVASALKELTNMDFVLISILFKKLVIEIYSRFHGPKKKVSTTWWLWHVRDFLRGGGDALHNGRHLGFVEIRKGMISFLILLVSFLCRSTKIFFLTVKVRNCGIFLFFLEKWRYMVFHNIQLPVCGIYVDKFNIIKYWWSK